MIKVGKDVTWQIKDRSYASQSFRLKGLRDEFHLTIPLLGDHQLDNAAVAVACLEVLADSEAGITPVTIADGMSQVNWPGRLQVLRHNPLFVLDCAHNADSAMKLRESIGRYFEFDDLLLIVGTSKEKDLPGIVAELAALPARIIVTRSDNPRAASTSVLVAEFSKWGIVPMVSETVASAVDLALAEAKPTDLVCATGSLFVVAEVSAYLKGVDREQYST